MRSHCVGVVIRDRIDLTRHTFNSLFYSTQPKDSYDLILIDNGSSKENSGEIKKLVKLLPVKNLVVMAETSVSKAWNLFLALSQDYEYRLKLDNDIVLHNTVKPPTSTAVQASSPGETDALAGAPRSVSVIKGAGRRTVKRPVNANSSDFLNMMTDFSVEHKTQITSLVPIPPTQVFGVMYKALSESRRNKMPYLIGSCMMISKTAFDKLGYFDERLPRRIDIEYTQRALRNGFNIGYHPYYGTVHLGSDKNTETKEEFQKKQLEANRVELLEPKIEAYSSSQWESVVGLIKEKCNENKVVHLR